MFSKKRQPKERSLYQLARQNEAEPNNTMGMGSVGTNGIKRSRNTDTANGSENPTLFFELKTAFIECCRHSTIHGCSNVARTKSIPIGIMWVVFLSLSIGICSYLIFGILANYLSYNVLILMNVVDESPVDFPAVTICNLNPFFRNGTKFIEETLQKNNLSYLRYQLGNETITPMAIRSLLQAAVASNKSLTEAQIQALGFDIGFMRLTCRFNDVECTEDDFYWTYNYDYGNCYTFNSGLNRNGTKAHIRKVSEAGADRSFRMDLFVGDDKSQNDYILNSGARVVIHNQTVRPIITSEGIDIATGYQTNIGVRRTFLTKLNYPYSNCIKDVTSRTSFNSSLYRIMFDVLNFTSYRQKNCLRLCLQEFVSETCNCSDGSLPIVDSSVKICSTLADLKCVSNSRMSYYSDPKTSACPECPLECSSVSYELSYSTSRYPTLYYLKFLRNQTDIVKRFPEPEEVSNSQIAKSTVLVNVFYDDLATTYTNEIPSINSDSLLGVIGGNLGLFIGMSLLSFAEAFELILQLLTIIIKHIYTPVAQISRNSLRINGSKQSSLTKRPGSSSNYD